MSEKSTRGGAREGAGRPPIEDPRRLRGLKFNDAEWDAIKQQAARQGLSVREYLWNLVQKDV